MGQGTHTIRLRGPWQLADGNRVKLPATWGEALGDAAEVTLTRSFNRPTNLSSDAVVLLRVESSHDARSIEVNNQPTASGSDIASLLDSANRLTVELARVAQDAPILDASLEITDP